MDRCMNVWDTWAAELVRVSQAAGCAGPIDSLVYRGYFEDGDTPAEAWLRDLRENR